MAVVGLISLVVAELLPNRQPQGVFAGIAFTFLVAAAVLALSNERTPATRSAPETSKPYPSPPGPWRLILAGLAVLGIAVTQTWFHAGTAVAGGDITPPIGTAWIGRIFSTYGSNVNSLGGPRANQGALPYASLDELVHLFGGTGALAQRIWLTFLVAAILIAGALLARSLRLSPLGALLVSILYFFNPLTLSQVGVNDVFLTAMVLAALLPATVIAWGGGTLRLWHLIAVFVLSAPFIGYVYANPPLVGMLVLLTAACPLLVWARMGAPAARRSFAGALLAAGASLLASLYWLIPSLLSTSQFALGRLSSTAAWQFTESRATLANAFALNTTWGWSFPSYFPFAHLLDSFPLRLVRILIPLIPFAGLAISPRATAVSIRAFRLLASLSLGTLLIILLSNGTRLPGALLFDPLYRLPYGWLLREPGRFLIAASMGFALMVGVLADLLGRTPWWHTTRSRLRNVTLGLITTRRMVAVAAVVVALVSGYPLWTGAIVLGRRGAFPSNHVAVPAYWHQAARYLNSAVAPTGSMLALPADDFYQMPYTWYYGNDEFLSNLFTRSTLAPSGQGYDSVPAQLLNAVDLEDSTLIAGEWTLAGRILDSLATPIVLVRGDIESTFPQRSITSPTQLESALARDPEMRLVHRFGPLSVYELKQSFRASYSAFWTTPSSTPDLRDLSLLSANDALITSAPRSGHPMIVNTPPISQWSITSQMLTTSLRLPSGWTYSVRAIGETRSSGVPAPHGVEATVSNSGSLGGLVRLERPLGPSLIEDPTFATGTWGSTGNCDAIVPVDPATAFHGYVAPHDGPGDTPALTLSASLDSACQSAPLAWHPDDGNVFLRFSSRSVAGGAPRICLWELPIGKCADVPTLSPSRTWQTSTFIVTPDPGTATIRLFVYADASNSGTLTETQYAGFTVGSIDQSNDLAIVGMPIVPRSGPVLHVPSPASPPSTDQHGRSEVLVDGLRHGWLSQ